MSVIYVLIYEDYDLGAAIYSVHKTKEGAEQAKVNKEEGFGMKEPGSGFEIESYKLHD